MRLLDLYCGAGGAAMGYYQAGFTEIVGVDIHPQPNYPFTFIQGDALRPPLRLEDFDLIHASPPCQAFSRVTPDPSKHPDLIEPTRRWLDGAERPYVIENVPGAPIHADLILCGSMFGLDIRRHRHFELGGFSAMGAGGCNHKGWQEGRPWTVVGRISKNAADKRAHDWRPSLDQAKALMEIDWMTGPELQEAIPPAYTEFIGEAFLAQVTV